MTQEQAIAYYLTEKAVKGMEKVILHIHKQNEAAREKWNAENQGKVTKAGNTVGAFKPITTPQANASQIQNVLKQIGEPPFPFVKVPSKSKNPNAKAESWGLPEELKAKYWEVSWPHKAFGVGTPPKGNGGKALTEKEIKALKF